MNSSNSSKHSNSAKPQELLYLEDLPVGRKFRSGTHAVDAEQIKAFAAEFDPQPFHLNEEAARGTLFGGLAASGWHTGAICMRLLLTALPIAGGIVGLGGELQWPHSTRPGDVLRVEAEIIEVVPSRSGRNRGTVIVQADTLNQRDEVVQAATIRLLVPGHPTTDGQARDSGDVTYTGERRPNSRSTLDAGIELGDSRSKHLSDE